MKWAIMCKPYSAYQPACRLLGSVASPYAAFGLIVVSLVIAAFYTSISGVVKAELFPAHIRALGVALPYAIANALFGGTAEYVALWFKQQGMESGSYIYVSAIMAVAFIVAVRLRNTNRESLITED